MLYRVPMFPGKQKATLLGSFKTGKDYNDDAITGAAINNNQQKIVILSHSKIWMIEDFQTDNFFNGNITEIPLQHYSQKEAITFKNDTVVWIADEKVKKSGGNVYTFKLNSLKSKP